MENIDEVDFESQMMEPYPCTLKHQDLGLMSEVNYMSCCKCYKFVSRVMYLVHISLAIKLLIDLYNHVYSIL